MKTIARNSDVTLVKLCPAIFQTFNYKTISKHPVKWKIADLVMAILSSRYEESNRKVIISFFNSVSFLNRLKLSEKWALMRIFWPHRK
jgi:hypothetical protein